MFQILICSREALISDLFVAKPLLALQRLLIDYTTFDWSPSNVQFDVIRSIIALVFNKENELEVMEFIHESCTD